MELYKIYFIFQFKDLNLLKDKITINKIKESDKEDIKIIKSFKIKKLYVSINESLSIKYCYFLYDDEQGKFNEKSQEEIREMLKGDMRVAKKYEEYVRDNPIYERD